MSSRRSVPLLLSLLIGAVLIASIESRAADAPEARFTGADLFNIAMVSDPQISPDGKRVVYVRMTPDIMTDKVMRSIWLVDAATGAQSPLVAGPGNHAQPRWSPDGSRIAYVSSSEGAPQLFVRWVGSGQSVRITGLPDSPSAIRWSPDGTRIAYVARDPGEGTKLGKPLAKPQGAQWAEPLQVIDTVTYRADGGGDLKPGFSHLFVVSAEGGAPRQLTFGPFHDNGPLTWTRDGQRLLFSANRKPDWQRNTMDSAIHAVDLGSGTLSVIADQPGPDTAPEVSPDGTQLAWLGYHDDGRAYQNMRVMTMPLAGGTPRTLTAALDRSVSKLTWGNDGTLTILYEDDGDVRVARLGRDGRITPLVRSLASPQPTRPYLGGEFSIARDGTLAHTIGDPLRPSDLAVTRGGKTRDLTHLNRDWLALKRLAAVQSLPVTAPDGLKVPAWLAIPADRKPGQRVPLILEIHGGPHAAYGPVWAPDVQMYASAGYAVLYTNPRGSTSYGEEFANRIDKNYPSADYDDLIAAVDAAIAAGVADPDNLFVTGGSGGGVLTAWIIGKTDRFKAAAVQKPVIDWSSFALTADAPAFFSRYWFRKKPWEDPMEYWNRSPLSLVGNVKTPALVLVGTQDLRTPISEAEQYYSALQLRGVPTALVKIPGASHGDATHSPSQLAAKNAAVVAWFDRYRSATPK